MIKRIIETVTQNDLDEAYRDVLRGIERKRNRMAVNGSDAYIMGKFRKWFTVRQEFYPEWKPSIEFINSKIEKLKADQEDSIRGFFQREFKYLGIKTIQNLEAKQKKTDNKISGEDKIVFFEPLMEIHRKYIRDYFWKYYTEQRNDYLANVKEETQGVRIYNPKPTKPYIITKDKEDEKLLVATINPEFKFSNRELYFLSMSAYKGDTLKILDRFSRQRWYANQELESYMLELSDTYLPDSVYRNESTFKSTIEKMIDDSIKSNELKLKDGIMRYLGEYDVVSVKDAGSKIGNKGIQGKFTLNLADGSTKTMTTESIGAGGYNIQKFHFRYIINVK